MFISLVAVTQPIELLGSNALCKWLIPAQHNAWADLPWWAMTGLLLIGDDLTQYLWHRASHTPLLWPLHRAHHSASY
ncbi:sterol desaturase family protein, partial [Klebsiella pneumoniae]|uniref:sterol desaturase family protein n=1 Tax=Klebsiella pneumoniae TaxID=573 RepID=UPI0027302675